MKKLIIFAACAMLAAVTNAAAVGWSLAGATGYAGDAFADVIISSADTANVEAGKYTYTITLHYADGTQMALTVPQPIVVMEVAGNGNRTN